LNPGNLKLDTILEGQLWLQIGSPALISVGSKKNPITPEWQLVTTDKSDAKKQGQRYIGILCGSVNQVDVIDCDIVKQEDVDRYNQNKTDCEQYKQEGYYSDAKGVHCTQGTRYAQVWCQVDERQLS